MSSLQVFASILGLDYGSIKNSGSKNAIKSYYGKNYGFSDNYQTSFDNSSPTPQYYHQEENPMKCYCDENYASSENWDNYQTSFDNTSPAPQYYQENPIFNLVIHDLPTYVYHLPNCILKPLGRRV